MRRKQQYKAHAMGYIGVMFKDIMGKVTVQNLKSTLWLDDVIIEQTPVDHLIL